jgi:methionyl aminopeptidase
MTITIKTAEDIEGMRVACRLASEVLDYIEPFIKPGITTNEIDKLCHIVTKDHSLSAQWEHTVVVTETGYEVLTLSAGSPAIPDFITAKA